MVLFLIALPNFTNAAVTDDDEKMPMHPTNKILVKMYPRPFALRFPNVPRVTALAALDYYEKGKALLIHVGVDAPNVLGGFNHEELGMHGLTVDRLKEVAKTKMIVTYCN